MPVTNLQEFSATLNAALNEQVRKRDEVSFVAARPTWFTGATKIDIKAEFAAMVASAKAKLDDCAAWIALQ